MRSEYTPQSCRRRCSQHSPCVGSKVLDVATVLNLGSSKELTLLDAAVENVCVPALGTENTNLREVALFSPIAASARTLFQQDLYRSLRLTRNPFIRANLLQLAFLQVGFLRTLIGTNKVLFHLASSPFPWYFYLFFLGLTFMCLRINWLSCKTFS